MKQYTLLGACCAYVLTFFISSANAATTFYDSQANYLSALGGAAITTYDFDALTTGTLIADGATLNGATFSYSLSGPGNPSILVDDVFGTTSPDNYLGTDDGSGAFVSGDGFTITFDQTMRSVGLYVISADLILANDFTITTNGGQNVSNTATPDINVGDGDAYFIGLIEDDYSLGFDSITLSSADFGFLFNVDDITVSPVPLPAAVWLFGGGLLGLVGIGRRTTRKS
jgi:hypothetical protein